MSEELTAIRQDVNAIRRDINDIKTILEDLPAIREMVAGLQFRSADKIETSETKTEPKKTTPPPEPKKKDDKTNISDLKEGDKSSKEHKINIEGTLVFDPIQKDIDTSKGPTAVTSLVLKDDTGEAKLSFWGDAGDPVMSFVKGDKIRVENIWRVKEFYDGKPQLDPGKFCKVISL